MVKRPLCFTCLIISLLFYLIISIKPVSYIDYSVFKGKEITVEGKVYKKEIVRQADDSVMVLYLKLTSGEGLKQKEKKVICYLKSGEIEPEMGSTVSLIGKLSNFERASNPGQFDAYSYYQISGISYRLNQASILAKSTNYNILTQTLYQIRGFFSGKLSENLPEKEASVMQTVLLGEKGGIDKELKALYQRNGIAHILAISGLHISLLGMGMYKLLRKCGVPMKIAAVSSTVIMFFYCVMTGFSVSAVRAVIMFTLHMAAVLAERTYDMLTAAAVAAVLLLFSQPLYLRYSGFAFSFGCVLGIGMVIPALTEGKHKWHPAVKGLLGSFGMMVITLPIYLWFYYQFPVYSVLLNLLILPLMSFLMAAGLLLMVSCILCPPVSWPFVFLIKGILVIYENACRICDGLPGNLLTPGKPRTWQIAIYLFLLIMLVFIKKKINMAVRWGIAIVSILFVIIPIRGGLKITFLDVGQGDCICIESERGKSYLVDGGSSNVSSVGEYRIIPFLKFRGISELEAVFVTHPDEDHCNGIKELIEMGALQGIKVKHLVLPDISKDAKNDAYLQLVYLAEETDIPVSYISMGQRVQDGELTIMCMHPAMGYQTKEANEYSIVLELTYGNFSAMLTGDVEGAGEQNMMHFLQEKEKGNRMTVLKAAHHGSAYSTPTEFLKATMPHYTVISCGENNSYGHPHEELLGRLMDCETNILITYETGAVSFETNGKKVKLRCFLQ